MKRSIHNIQMALLVAPIMGVAALVLPLYLYPIATIDPLDAYPYYTSPDFFKIYLPYALIFLASSMALFLKFQLKPAIVALCGSFIFSHAHFALYFGERIVFKPVFVVVFILIPSFVFILAALSLFLKGK